MNKILLFCLISSRCIYAPADDFFNDAFKIDRSDALESKTKTLKEMMAENRRIQEEDALKKAEQQSREKGSFGVKPESVVHETTVHLAALHERYPSDVSTDQPESLSRSTSSTSIGHDDTDTDSITPTEISTLDFEKPIATSVERKEVEQDPFEKNMQSSVSRDYQKSEPEVQQLLEKNKVLIEAGVKPSRQAIEQSLKIYENFVTMSQIEREVPTLNPDLDNRPKASWWKRIANKFLKTDYQKTTAVTEHRIASKLAQNIFILDDAASKSVITAEQRAKISTLEAEYKTTWQRARSWWNRLWKK